YVPFKVDNIGDFIRAFRGLDVKGYSVTIPHKESVVNHLDAIDPMAKKIGAVNTIVNRGGQLVGFNTDCEAAIKVLITVHPHLNLPPPPFSPSVRGTGGGIQGDNEYFPGGWVED
ncbi:MAG: hypothetical protein NUV74_18335, partial [Candidatus Brocadiaceae bacterium]|nr:hypothetical protein [Candidatus Brocadiaceae bacterium]